MIDIQTVITEQRNPNSTDIDLKSIAEIVDIFHEEDSKAVEAVASQSDAIAFAVEIIVDAFSQGGRLFYIGAGTSGRLGVLDASECPPTFSTEPEMVQGIIAGGDIALRKSVEGEEDKPGKWRTDHKGTCADLSRRNRWDCEQWKNAVCFRCTKGSTQIWCKKRFSSVVFPPKEELNTYIDHFITPIVGPEIITGSTRLKAGTATKLVLNMLTTISMIRMGKVYNNLMVDVNASNTKLVERSIRIIQSVTAVDDATALATLKKSDGSAKVAIVMLIKGVEKNEATGLLDKYDGFLRPILTENEISE